MLRDVTAYYDWLRVCTPSRPRISRVRTYIAELGTMPWRAPSVPWPEISRYPVFEFRYAWLWDVGTEIIYVHHFEGDDVDLVHVWDKPA